MGSIKLKCVVKGSIKEYDFNLTVYDIYDEIIYKYSISNNQELVLNLKNGIYKFVVVTNSFIYPNKKIIVLCIKDESIRITFDFNEYYSFYIYPRILVVTDLIYEGLPIMKGEIILWQDST